MIARRHKGHEYKYVKYFLSPNTVQIGKNQVSYEYIIFDKIIEKFTVDSGSAICLIDERNAPKNHMEQTNAKIAAANGIFLKKVRIIRNF